MPGGAEWEWEEGRVWGKRDGIDSAEKVERGLDGGGANAGRYGG